ncbi:Delta-like protein 1, partial [Fragariocoptes setiger]
HDEARRDKSEASEIGQVNGNDDDNENDHDIESAAASCDTHRAYIDWRMIGTLDARRASFVKNVPRVEKVGSSERGPTHTHSLRYGEPRLELELGLAILEQQRMQANTLQGNKEQRQIYSTTVAQASGVFEVNLVSLLDNFGRDVRGDCCPWKDTPIRTLSAANQHRYYPSSSYAAVPSPSETDSDGNFTNVYDALDSLDASASDSYSLSQNNNNNNRPPQQPIPHHLLPSCNDKCVLMIRICVKYYQTNIDPSQCTFGEIRGQVVHLSAPTYNGRHVARQSSNSNNNINKIIAFNQPIQFPFNFSWPGSFSLIIDAWREWPATGQSQQVVHQYQQVVHQQQQQHQQVRTSDVIQHSMHGWLTVKHDWTNNVHRTDSAALTYAYRVTCQANYYGEQCATLCRPRDDAYGHYTCSAAGSIVCLAGWHGDYCLEATCLPGCHKSQGNCSRPGECNCRYGWQGALCDQCARYPGCVHGTCRRPHECVCEEGWGGLLCNEDLNYCTNHKPCKNGAICTNTFDSNGTGSYTCACPFGFVGRNCERRVRSKCHDGASPCLNGGECFELENKEMHCTCPVSFSGRHCEISSSSTNAAPNNNDQLINNDIVSTLANVSTNNRTRSVPLSYCMPNPCRNGGTCYESMESSDYRCECTTPWGGKRCDIPAGMIGAPTTTADNPAFILNLRPQPGIFVSIQQQPPNSNSNNNQDSHGVSNNADSNAKSNSKLSTSNGRQSSDQHSPSTRKGVSTQLRHTPVAQKSTEPSGAGFDNTLTTLSLIILLGAMLLLLCKRHSIVERLSGRPCDEDEARLQNHQNLNKTSHLVHGHDQIARGRGHPGSTHDVNGMNGAGPVDSRYATRRDPYDDVYGCESDISDDSSMQLYSSHRRLAPGIARAQQQQQQHNSIYGEHMAKNRSYSIAALNQPQSIYEQGPQNACSVATISATMADYGYAGAVAPTSYGYAMNAGPYGYVAPRINTNNDRSKNSKNTQGSQKKQQHQQQEIYQASRSLYGHHTLYQAPPIYATHMAPVQYVQQVPIEYHHAPPSHYHVTYAPAYAPAQLVQAGPSMQSQQVPTASHPACPPPPYPGPATTSTNDTCQEPVDVDQPGTPESNLVD